MKKYIGEEIKKIRLKKELSQLGTEVLTKPTISRIERGDKSYLVSNLFALLNSLNSRLLLIRDNDVFEVCNKEEVSSVLQKWRGGKSLYSLAKPAGVNWRRLAEIESCSNYGIDLLIVYLELLGAKVDIMTL